jgi:2'-hydroxyisoflavone reductase
MSTSRRRFLKLSALAGGSIGAGLIPGINALGNSSSFIGQAPKPLNILILGGTGFTGPRQVEYALKRGHKVTVFNRGKTHPGILPKEAEQLLGDRNLGQVEALKDRKWDVCIDIPTTLPFWVRDAAQVLKGNVDRYVFISTISVFSDVSKPNMDENGPLAEYKGADALKETMETFRANMGLYGPLKAQSEKEAEKWFPGKALIIRPGLIVGPGDESDRFTYWPVRIEKGGEVLAPGTPQDPVQFIDARDLAEWVIRMAEQGTVGTFNATGPNYKLTMGKMFDEIKAATKSNATFTWADSDFLRAQKVRAWSDMPTWVPPKGDSIGFSQINVQKAISKGLTFRSIGDTTKATLAWFHQQTPERQAKLKAGLTAEREAAVLAAWHAQQKPGD